MTAKTLHTIKRLAIALALLALALWIGGNVKVRFDLTEEKRYTLSDATKELLVNLDDTIRVSVYLEGDLPMSFRKMRRDIEDQLSELQDFAGQKQFLIKFIDPSSLGDGKNFKNSISRLQSYGLMPYTIQEENAEGKIEQRIIIPGMIISTSQAYEPVNLLGNALGNSHEEKINNALKDFEYQCVKAITKITATSRKNIAFLTDQGELPLLYSHNATFSLLDLYNVDKVNSQQLLDSIDKYEVLIIAEPIKAFTESHKFVIDQYLMHNGNLLFLSDNISVSMDSLRKSSYTYAMPKDLNVNDLLFNIGVRINPTVLLDRQCAKIPMNVANFGEPARFAPVPWYYYPLLRPEKNHVITKNIDVVKADFSSSLDTIEGNGSFTKTMLLSSSAYARVIATPNTVGFQVLQSNPDNQFFNAHYVPCGVLIEGQCNSLFQNRTSPLQKDTLKVPVDFERKQQSERNRIIVVSDGDIIRNEIEVTGTDTVPQPLYVYKYAQIDKRVYTGNLDFFLNSVSYLSGEESLLSVRSREIIIRLLNKNRIVAEKSYWKLLNLVAPIISIALAGVAIFGVRKYKYSKKYVG